MSAELDVIETGAYAGKKAMFSVGATPWHDPEASTVIATAPDLDTGLELMGGTYRVDKVPLRYVVDLPAPNGEGTITVSKESAKAWVTMRMDRGTELGSVGPDYRVVQNVDAFRLAIGPLLDAGVMQLETGGILRQGAQAWMMGKFDMDKFGPVAREQFEKEGIVDFGTVIVDHSGHRAIELALTKIRIVCANTCGMVTDEIDASLGKGKDDADSETAARIAHVGDVEGRIVLASEKLFHRLVERSEALAAQFKLLRETHLSAEEFEDLIIGPSIGRHPTERKGWNPEARMAGAVIERYEKKHAAIVDAWDGGEGHVGDHSAFEAYQGLVEVVDHDTELFPTRSGVYRTQALLSGNLREMKDDVLAAVVKHAGWTPELVDLAAVPEYHLK